MSLTASADDFQTSSKELEEELERELAATEKQQAELKDRIQKLEAEKEEWKVCPNQLHQSHKAYNPPEQVSFAAKDAQLDYSSYAGVSDNTATE